MPKISIVIPMYNAEAYIDTCFNSILAQTYADFEVIAVNDGSKDNTFEKAQAYALKDPRFTILSKENGGHTSARKMGCEYAKGEFIKCIDVDDAFPADCLELLIKRAETYDLDLVQGSHRMICLDGTIKNEDLGSEGIIDSKEFAYRLLAHKGGGGPNISLFKRSLLNKFTFSLPKEVKVYEDSFMILSIALEAKRIGLFPDIIVYHYYAHSNSLTHKYKKTSSRPYEALISQIASLLEAYQLKEHLSEEIEQLAIEYAVECCMNNTDLQHDAWVQKVIKSGVKPKRDRATKIAVFFIKQPACLFRLFFYVNALRRKLRN